MLKLFKKKDKVPKSFIITNDNEVVKINSFTNCLANDSNLDIDYYRFSFKFLDDIKLYIAGIYDEDDNIADINTILDNYSDIITKIDKPEEDEEDIVESIDKLKKKYIEDEDIEESTDIDEIKESEDVIEDVEEEEEVKEVDNSEYLFNMEIAISYIKELVKEMYDTDEVVGLNSIIHGYSDDGYIDYYLVIGDEVFDKYFYQYAEKVLSNTFKAKVEAVLKEIMVDEMNEQADIFDDIPIDNALIEELKDTRNQVQDLVNRVNQISGSNISIDNVDPMSGSLEIEEEVIEEPCDILRYITYTKEDGEEEEVQIKRLPKLFNDWEERFGDQLTGSEIDAVNELYGRWYAKKNKGKQITLPDGRKANINTQENKKLNNGGTGNAIADAITTLSESGNSEASALIGALAAMANSGNVMSSNNTPPEEPKGPEFDIDKLEETMNNNLK